MTVIQALRKLASWRRQDRGIWKVTVIIDGWDEEFTYLYPGAFNRKQVSILAKRDTELATGEKKKHMRIASAERGEH